MMFPMLFLAALLAGQSVAYDTLFKYDAAPIVENRTLDQIYKAALPKEEL